MMAIIQWVLAENNQKLKVIQQVAVSITLHLKMIKPGQLLLMLKFQRKYRVAVKREVTKILIRKCQKRLQNEKKIFSVSPH
jgi:hypothetical protein